MLDEPPPGGCIGHDVDTSQLALHRVQHVRIALADGALHVHHGYGTRQVGLALHLITGHHDFLQLLGILFHLHRHAVLGRQLHGIVADVGDDQRPSGLHLELEVAVEVGHGAVRRTFFHHRSTNHGS